MSNFPQPLPTSLTGTSPTQTSQGRNKGVLWPKTVGGIFEFLGAAWQSQKDSGTQQEEADLKSVKSHMDPDTGSAVLASPGIRTEQRHIT